jgi:hypothetical protein
MASERVLVRHRPWLAGAAMVALTLGLAACASPSDANGAAGTPAGQAPAPQELRVIQHEVPKRDFVGAPPTEFRWSPIQGADRYAIGLWNETDRLMWRKDDITGTSVPMPKELYLDYGTYFWSVSALQNDREIAKSGMAAFVIEE